MESIVTGDLKAQMWNVFLDAGRSSARLTVTLFLHLEHRQQRRVLQVIIQPHVVMTTGTNTCTFIQLLVHSQHGSLTKVI